MNVNTETLSALQTSSTPVVGEKDADKLLAAMLVIEESWLQVFRHEPEFLTIHSWNVFRRFWSLRHSDKPIDKNEVLSWRTPDGEHAIIGKNKAREHLDLMLQEEFLEEYILPKVNRRARYIRANQKLYDTFWSVLSQGVKKAKELFETK